MDLGVKAYYRDILLTKQTFSAVKSVVPEMFIYQHQQHSVPTHRATVQLLQHVRLPTLLPLLICGRQIAPT